MDTEKNRDNKTNRPQGQEWENPDFAWDEMKEGIFGKILEEEPDFFEEKPRRRVAIWFWLGAVALVIAGLGVWQFANLSGARAGGTQSASPNTPVTEPMENTAPATTPVAEVPPPSTEEDLPKEIDEAPVQSATTATSATPTAQTRIDLVVFESKKTSATKISSETRRETATEIESPNEARNPATIVDAPISDAPKNIEIDIPALLAVALQPLKIDSSLPQLPATNFAAGEEEKTTKPKGQWKVAATGGTLLSFSKYTGSGAAADLRNDHTSPYFGYQFGVQAAAPLSERSHLLFGLNRQVVYQNIDIRTERQVEVLHENALLHVTHYVVGDRVSEVFGDTLLNGTERNRLVNYNEFRSVQAHAGYLRNFENKNWMFSPHLGLAIGMVDHQEGLTVAEDKSIFAFNQNNPIIKRFQLNTLVGVNVERKIAGDISLVFQYRFHQQWNNASAENGLTLRPASHFCSVGLTKRW